MILYLMKVSCIWKTTQRRLPMILSVSLGRIENRSWKVLGLGRLGGRGRGSSGLGRTSHLHRLQVLDLVRVQLLHVLQLRNLPVADAVEHGLEGLGLEHHVLDEVNIKVVQVHRAD